MARTRSASVAMVCTSKNPGGNIRPPKSPRARLRAKTWTRLDCGDRQSDDANQRTEEPGEQGHLGADPQGQRSCDNAAANQSNKEQADGCGDGPVIKAVRTEDRRQHGELAGAATPQQPKDQLQTIVAAGKQRIAHFFAYAEATVNGVRSILLGRQAS